MTSNSPTNTKKVIAILATFPLDWLEQNKGEQPGRSQYWLVSLAQAFSKQSEFEVHWLVFKNRVPAKTITYNGQFFHILPSVSHAFNAATHYLQARWAVKRVIKKINPSLVHAWGTEGYYGICGQSFNGPKILSIQGLLNAYIERSPMGKYMHRQAKLEKSTIQSYDLVTAESPWAVDRVKELVPEAPVVQWEYAVDDGFRHIERTIAEQPEVLMVCGNAEYKNIPTAIKAFASPQLAHVKLRIAGVPPHAYPHATANVELMGKFPHDKIPQLMAQAWCLLQPSLAETGPTVAKEAKMVGLPLILSSQCGSKQYIEEGKSGFIVEPCDIQGIINSVLAVTESKDRSLAMGLYGREECCRALTQDYMMNRLMQFYRTLLNNGASD